MRVALDATPLAVPTGGIRRYTEQLALALARAFPEDEYTLVSDQAFDMPAAAPPNLRCGLAPHGAIARRWWTAGLALELARMRAGVFHGTDFAVPYLPLRPAVMTIHDLSPWRYPEWQPEAGRIRRRTPAMVRLGLAAMIVTPSEAVRREVIERFGAAPSRVVAVPLAPAFAPRASTVPPPVEPPYFLLPGTVEPRKNIATAIQAWRPVFETSGVKLVLAGRRRADSGDLAPPEPGLVELGEVTEAQLASLYASAVACLYPSHYEGFGLPVLEAMQCGAPVIASRDPAVMETAGDAAMLVDSRDVCGWREAIHAATESPQRMAGLRERGRRRAAGFSWDRTACATREVYIEAIRRHG